MAGINETWRAQKIHANPRTGKRRMVEAQAPTKTAARQRNQKKSKTAAAEGDMPWPEPQRSTNG